MIHNRAWDNEGKANRLYGRKWRKLRAAFLRGRPFCVMCEQAGMQKLAGVVNHIVPHKGDEALFWDDANWQPLCAWHHNSEKAKIEIRGYSDRIGSDSWPLDPVHPTNSRIEPVSGKGRPDDLLPLRIPVFLVVGPPGSGKTTWCQAQMQAGDVLIDFDQIDKQQNGLARQPHRLIVPILRERNTRLRNAAALSSGRVFLPMLASRLDDREWWRRKLGSVTVVMMDAEEETCIARIKADDERAATAGEAQRRSRGTQRFPACR